MKSTFKTIPRRIVTEEKNARSIITSDSEAQNVLEHFPGLIISDIWVTNSSPADLTSEIKIENTAFPVTPPAWNLFPLCQYPARCRFRY